MKHIDLHTHTTYSDGIDTPENLVRRAALVGIDVLAITDHDHIQAYFDAQNEAKKWGIELVPGIEVTTPNYHILGLYFDANSREFAEFVVKSRNLQKKICELRLEKLKGSLPITLEKILKIFPVSRIGKMNILFAALQDEGCRQKIMEELGTLDSDSIYNHYFRKKNVKVHGIEIQPSEAIDAIHKAGGIAVIAHPFKDVKDMSELDELVKLGLDGIEVQPNFGDANKPFEEYAKQHGLLITYGSDHHGAYKPKRMLLGRRFGLENKSNEHEVIQNEKTGASSVRELGRI